MKLSDLSLNKSAIISKFNIKNKEYLCRLYNLGLKKGVKLRVEFWLKNKRASVISFNGKAVILSSEILNSIEVILYD